MLFVRSLDTKGHKACISLIEKQDTPKRLEHIWERIDTYSTLLQQMFRANFFFLHKNKQRTGVVTFHGPWKEHNSPRF